jgi:hypothetical protein
MDVTEWSFTSQSIGRLGATLHTLLRDHRLVILPDQELLDELATVRSAGQHRERSASTTLRGSTTTGP